MEVIFIRLPRPHFNVPCVSVRLLFSCFPVRLLVSCVHVPLPVRLPPPPPPHIPFKHLRINVYLKSAVAIPFVTYMSVAGFERMTTGSVAKHINPSHTGKQRNLCIPVDAHLTVQLPSHHFGCDMLYSVAVL